MRLTERFPCHLTNYLLITKCLQRHVFSGHLPAVPRRLALSSPPGLAAPSVRVTLYPLLTAAPASFSTPVFVSLTQEDCKTIEGRG